MTPLILVAFGSGGYRKSITITPKVMIYRAWGQTIEQVCGEPDVWELVIERAILRVGEVPRVGVSAPICQYLAKRRSKLIVKCLEPEAEFSVDLDSYFLKQMRRAKLIHKIPSKFQGSKPMVFYLFKLPERIRAPKIGAGEQSGDFELQSGQGSNT